MPNINTVALLLLFGAAMLTLPTHGAPPNVTVALESLDPTLLDLMLKQRPLSAAAHEILNAIPISDRLHGGFAGIQLAEDAVELWWKGEVPSSILATINVVNQVVTIHVRKADFSLSELEEAAAPLREYVKDPDSIYHTVALPFDGSRVIVRGEVPTFALPLDLGVLAAEGIPAELRAPGNGVSVVVEHTLAPIPAQQFLDTPPWEGGIAICNGRARCTSGFAVYNELNENFLLTAAHCGLMGDTWYACDQNFARGTQIGATRARWTDRDLLLVKADPVNGAMWNGPIGGSFLTGVITWADVFGGELLCHSGTTSGVVCGLRVDQTSATVCYPNLFCASNMVFGAKVDGSPAIRGGDSGGPVFQPWSDNKAIAKGINSGGNGDTLIIFGKFFEANQFWKLNVATS